MPAHTYWGHRVYFMAPLCGWDRLNIFINCIYIYIYQSIPIRFCCRRWWQNWHADGPWLLASFKADGFEFWLLLRSEARHSGRQTHRLQHTRSLFRTLSSRSFYYYLFSLLNIFEKFSNESTGRGSVYKAARIEAVYWCGSFWPRRDFIWIIPSSLSIGCIRASCA